MTILLAHSVESSVGFFYLSGFTRVPDVLAAQQAWESV